MLASKGTPGGGGGFLFGRKSWLSGKMGMGGDGRVWTDMWIDMGDNGRNVL